MPEIMGIAVHLQDKKTPGISRGVSWTADGLLDTLLAAYKH
jgi:hypothetical protein